jgi:hypothetical protein
MIEQIPYRSRGVLSHMRRRWFGALFKQHPASSRWNFATVINHASYTLFAVWLDGYRVVPRTSRSPQNLIICDKSMHY